MAEQLQPIDLNTNPDLYHIVDEVAATRTPRHLQRNGQDIAVVKPAVMRPRVRKGQPTSADDPIWTIVGMAHSDGPGDVAANHDKYLAEAYLDRHE